MDVAQQYIDARKQSLPYYLAEQFAMHTNRPLFITGKAGTGKTTFLRKLRELFLEGTPIAQIAKEFNRTQGAIRSRLKKFGLIE